MDLSGACGFDPASSVCVPVQIPLPVPLNNCGYVPLIPASCGIPKCQATNGNAGKQAALTALLNNSGSTTAAAPVKRTWPTVLSWVLLAAVIAGALGLLVWWLSRARHTTKPQAPSQTPVTPQTTTAVPATQPPGSAATAANQGSLPAGMPTANANRPTAALLGAQRNPNAATNNNANKNPQQHAPQQQALQQQQQANSGNCDCGGTDDYVSQRQQQQVAGFQTAFAPGGMPHNWIGGSNLGGFVGVDKSIHALSSVAPAPAPVHATATSAPMRIPRERHGSAWQGARNSSFFPISDALPGPRSRHDMKPLNIRDYIQQGAKKQPNMQVLMQGMGIDESLFFPSDTVHSNQYNRIALGGTASTNSETLRWLGVPDFTAL